MRNLLMGLDWIYFWDWYEKFIVETVIRDLLLGQGWGVYYWDWDEKFIVEAKIRNLFLGLRWGNFWRVWENQWITSFSTVIVRAEISIRNHPNRKQVWHPLICDVRFSSFFFSYLLIFLSIPAFPFCFSFELHFQIWN